MPLSIFLGSLKSITRFSNASKAQSFLITHLLPTSLDYIRQVHKAWPIQGIVAIPYSVDYDVVEDLCQEGISIRVPHSIEEVPTDALEMIEESMTNSRGIVVQEVGGYLAPYMDRLMKLPNFLGIVEDTAQGHWRYAVRQDCRIPIISIAQNPLKMVEDSLVGDAVVYSLERVMREEFYDVIQGKNCLVVGYGKIGRSCAIALRGREAHVAVFDKNISLNLQAQLEGYGTGSFCTLLSNADIVVGATGHVSILADLAPYIAHGAVLVSASSRDVEFDLAGLAPFLIDKRSDLIWLYQGPCDNRFVILNRGMPINFRDKSILGRYLYLVYGALYYSMNKLVCGEALPGLQELDEEDNSVIVSSFLNLLGNGVGGVGKQVVQLDGMHADRLLPEDSNPQGAKGA